MTNSNDSNDSNNSTNLDNAPCTCGGAGYHLNTTNDTLCCDDCGKWLDDTSRLGLDGW